MDRLIRHFILATAIFLTFSLTFALIPHGMLEAVAQSKQQQSSSSSSSLNCRSIPSKIGGKAFVIPNPNHDVCDILILRDSPQIKGHNGTILNKFLAINSLVEITPMMPNMTAAVKTSTVKTPSSQQPGSNPKVIAMGEFALLQTELKPVLTAISRSDWNVTAVHNHPILEKPAMIFVHWDAQGALDTIINQTKGVLMQTSMATHIVHR